MSKSLCNRNLLVGIIAWQKKFISKDVLVAAIRGWVAAKDKGLAQVLREQNALTENQHALLEEAVFEHLRKHDNDPVAALAALPSVDPIKQDLAKIGDAEVRSGLAQVATVKPKPK